jgi:CRP-like cAMP-binding protein
MSTEWTGRYTFLKEALPPGFLDGLPATTVKARAGQTLMSVGTSSTSVYVVLEGRVQVAIFSPAGREVILRDLDRGAIFGELAALDDQPRSATIVALAPCLLLSIPGERFRAAVFENPAAAAWMTRRLVAQIRDLTERVFELNTLRVPSRLHCELLRLAGPQRDGDGQAVIDPFPTHAELAARIGTHREAVTRELSYLGGCGIIEQQRRRAVVTDLPALAALVRDVAGDGISGLAR